MNDFLEELFNHFILILNEDQCVDRIENAGVLGHFLDMAATDGPKVKLHYQQSQRIFTLDDAYQIQIGAVPLSVDNSQSAQAQFGLVAQPTMLSTNWDMLFYVNDPLVNIRLDRLAMAFSRVESCFLSRIELNPVQVVLRHGLVYPKEIVAYPPNLRAFAFNFTHQNYLTKY